MAQNIRNIPEPPGEIHLSVGIPRSLQTPPVLDYIKTESCFLVEIRFHGDQDVAIAYRCLENSRVRLHCYRKDRQKELRYFVSDEGITSSITEDQMFQWANDDFFRMCGAIALEFPLFQTPYVRCIVNCIRPNHLRAVRQSQPVLVPGQQTHREILQKLQRPQSISVGQVLNSEDSCSSLKEALYHCGIANTPGRIDRWFALYKAYEVVRHELNGDRKLCQALEVCEKDLRNFKHTANHQGAAGQYARHARLTAKAPQNPMSLEEAQQFICSMVKKWHELSSPRSR